MEPAPAADPAPDAANEAALVEKARAGDPAAFRELVELHQDRAYGLALRMLRSPEDARDVAQEAFVRAWQSLGSFRGDSRFGTWLHRIVVRRALDRADTLRRRRSRETDLEEAEVVGAPAEGREARERARRLESLMDRLSDVQRVVVTLFYYEGRSVEDVASTLGLPANTVKTHLHRARAALREGWEKQERSGS
jgi:RNA polymerase sigma-70 factor (ECF subfamily)